MKNKVNRVVKCVAFFGLALSTQIVAANGAAVSHSHNGRTHSHPLPSEGLSHSHGAENSSPNHAQSANGWIKIGDAGANKINRILFHIKQGSLEVKGTYLQAIGRETHTLTNEVQLLYYAISFEDCKNELGYLNNFKLNGSFAGKSEFVFGSGTVATSIAEAICGAGAKYIR